MFEETLKKHLDIILVVIFFFLSFILRGYEVKNIAPYPDESTYLIYSLKILSNEWIMPRDCMLYQPPLFFYIQAVIIHLFGGDLEVLRFVSVITGSLTVCFIYLIGKSLFDRRVGFLSAIFLSFLNFHILYSRIYMLEATAIFFIVGSLYFFWKGYCEDAGMRYIYLSAIFHGLAIDTKYIGIIVFITIILFIVWTERSWHALLDKRIILFCIISFLVVLPVLVMLYTNDANIFYYNIIERRQLLHGAPSHISSVADIPIIELISRGYWNYVEMLTRGDYYLPWPHLLQIVALITFPVTILCHLPAFLKAKPSETFLLFFFVVGLFFILFLGRFMYYLLYSLMGFTVLMSNLYISSIDRLKARSINLSSIPSLFAILLAFVLIGSNIFIGAMSPVIDKGQFGGSTAALLYVDKQLAHDPGRVHGEMMGFVYQMEVGMSTTYITLNDIEHIDWEQGAIPVIVMRLEEKGMHKFLTLDSEVIKSWKPMFIVTSRMNYDTYFESEDKEILLRHYELVFSSKNTNPHEGEYIVFERKSTFYEFSD